MKKIVLHFFLLLVVCQSGFSQLLSWSPAFPAETGNITITLDASLGNKALVGFGGSVYVHVGVITSASSSASDWKYVKFQWGTADAAAQATPAGTNKWTYSISNLRAFLNVPAGEVIRKIAILFRDASGNTVQRNADGSDMYVPVYGNGLAVRFSAPLFQPLYTPLPEPITKSTGESITVTAISNQTARLKLYLNGTEIQSDSATTVSATPVLTSSGNQEVIVWANAANVVTTDTFRFFVSPGIQVAALPAGVQDGLNYQPGDTSVVFVLYAPGKTRVSMIGEFPGSNWSEQAQYVMNKTPDGNYWWLRVTGLTPGTEYAFQYLVDGTLRTTDPYVAKILDPANDPYISSLTYPGLRGYPSGASGIVGIVQTGKPAYNWAVPDFNRPDKRGLLVYELLLRDFLAAHDWKTLIDTLSYLKSMGINAIEVMPFNEFEGNESWGYNPDFFFAPDKYYGPEADLKRFIDSCHSKGIAVIMDMVLNHATALCPLAALYWDAANNRPAANSPWFNPVATHPFSVFNDFNHESPATKYFVKRVTQYWLNNFKLDGFRFDLSKGFTQRNSGTDVNAWSAYDAGRVAIWKAYYDTIQVQEPGAYVILEHFADNTEEKELANYGMMLWGNMNYNFNEASMGYVGTSNFEAGIASVRGWTEPHLVTYMESHDEERLMYKNLQFGNSSGSYSTRNLNTALRRVEECAAFLIAIPGPKLIWQFGEMGYDYSINYCQDGTINNACRVDKKPIRWDYLQNEQRLRLHDIYAAMLQLRAHPAYRAAFLGNNAGSGLSGAIKWISVTTDSSKLFVVGNFDVVAQTGTVAFPAAGTWYDYLQGGTVTATGAVQSVTLQPGEYHVYLNRNITNVVTTPVFDIDDPASGLSCDVYPNPVVAGKLGLTLNLPQSAQTTITMYNVQGQKLLDLHNGFLQKGAHQLRFDFSHNEVPAGNYFLTVRTGRQFRSVKFVIY